MILDLYDIHVCAWCKSIYDDHGKKLIKLDEEEYSLFTSHGICLECNDGLLNN